MTTPPFPYSRKEVDEPIGLPILLADSLGDADLRHLHYGEVGLSADQLVTSGLYGWTMVVTGTGPTISAARSAAYDRVRRIAIPNVRYRLDIGDRLEALDYARLERLDLLTPN